MHSLHRIIDHKPVGMIDDDTHGPLVLKCTITLCSLTALVVCHRLVFVYLRRGWIGVEDVVLLAAMASLIALTIIAGLAVSQGFGYHAAVIASTGGNLAQAMMYSWLFRIIYKLTIGLKKLTFLFLYLRLFPSKATQKYIWVAITVIVAGIISFTTASIVECNPIDRSFNYAVHGKCYRRDIFQWSWAGFDMATDLWIILIPFPSIQRLRMPLARKVGAMLLFSLGLLCIIIAAVRTATIKGANKAQTRHDLTYGSAAILIWSHVEACIGLICTCIPSLKMPLSRLLEASISAQRSFSRSRSQHIRTTSTSTQSFRVSHGSIEEIRPDGLFIPDPMPKHALITISEEKSRSTLLLPTTPSFAKLRESRERLLTRSPRSSSYRDSRRTSPTAYCDVPTYESLVRRSSDFSSSDYGQRYNSASTVDHEKEIQELFSRSPPV